MKKKLEKNQSKKILDRAYYYLARRNHSEAELKSKLLKKFAQEPLVEKVITRLKKLGYVNNEKFAREWIEYRLSCKPRGRVVIKRELQVKGVEVELVEKMLALVYNGDREKKEFKTLSPLIDLFLETPYNRHLYHNFERIIEDNFETNPRKCIEWYLKIIQSLNVYVKSNKNEARDIWLTSKTGEILNRIAKNKPEVLVMIIDVLYKAWEFGAYVGSPKEIFNSYKAIDNTKLKNEVKSKFEQIYERMRVLNPKIEEVEFNSQ